MQWRVNDTTTTRQTKEEITFDCFSPPLTHCLLTWEGQSWWNITREEKAELCSGCWLVIFLSLNVFHWMWSNEWNPYNSYQGDSEKNGHQKSSFCPNLSPFAFVCCLQPSPTSSWSLTILSNLYLYLCLHLCLSLHPVPHSFLLSPTILSPLL